MSNKLKNAIHGYIVLDAVSWTEEDWEGFNQLKKQYFLDFVEINTINDRTMYYIAMRDYSLMQDREIEYEDGEKETELGVMTLFLIRNPEILGVWNKDGSEFGTEISVTPATYDDAGELLEAQNEEIMGEPKYLFNKELYCSYIEPRVQIDEVGNELSRVEFYDANNFSGFKKRGFE